jgi:phage terminase large subunit-like protein
VQTADQSNTAILPRGKRSWIEYISSLPIPIRKQALAGVTEDQAREILFDWRLNGRPAQLIPGTPGAELSDADWRFWVVQAGRGFGKTRTGAETVREWARDPTERILMIAPVASDVREVMIEGPSGIMACYPPGPSGCGGTRPDYNPSRHLLTFPSGAVGITRSADEPERLRGPQFTKFWWDEPCACRFADEAWDQISFGFRLPTPNLRGVITTTPKPIPVMRKLLANRSTVVTRGTSYDNRGNLSDDWFKDVIEPYEGTRLGRQEILAEMLDDTPGALWQRAMFEREGFRLMLRDIRWNNIVRVVVAIDPAVSTGEGSAETGIVVAALAISGHVCVLADLSLKGTPLEWAKVAVKAFSDWRADRIVAEVNNGGDLVGGNIFAVAPNVPFRAVRATRGKLIRAEPVSALYEQGRVHHLASFPALEDQLCTWVPGEKSPDRMDALVWALTELVVDPEPVTTRHVINANPPPAFFG